ncbi:TonB-dependent receptor [bacterium]|nr:TonB-dependent receptor [bacterium]MBU1958435.1 TonB-dependent receptor [bacterium]
MTRHLKLFTISLFAVIPPFAYAQEVGTLSVFMLKSGKPLSNNEIIIDSKKTIRTDADGSVKVILSVGEHQIEIFGKSANNKNLGYFKKPVTIKEGKDTQVVASFTMSEPEIDIDTPVGEVVEDKKKDQKAKGKGTLKGRVLSSDRQTPITGARVFVKGTSIDTRTDDAGRFSVEIPADSAVSISVVHSAYSAQTINDINVAKGATISKTVKLTPASLELEEFVVLAPKIEGSIADIMTEEKEASAISNILGSEEFEKKGDGNAAAALKRVTGITLVGGKNIYVRGLGERYSNIEMNSMPLPSPDPTKRTVPLDIFPSSVIGSLKVQKSASADIPSNFGGGYIDIRTKDTSKEDFIKVSLGTSANSNTGKESDNYYGSETDWLGYDNGYRAIVDDILAAGAVNVGERIKSFTPEYFTEEQLVQYTTDFVDRNYNTYTRKLPIGLSGSIEGSKNFEINEEHSLSVFANYGYSQDHTYTVENFYDYDIGTDGQLHSEADKYGTNAKSYSSYYQGGSFNLGYNYLDLLKVKYTKLYTRNAVKATRIVDGVYGSNYDQQTNYYLDWEERILNVDQLNGEFDYEIFNKKSKAEFGLEYAQANLYQPNNFNYAYIEEQGVTHINNAVSAPHVANRLKSDDDLYAMFVKNKIFIDWLSDEDTVEFGMNYSSKERISRQSKFNLRPIGAVDVNDADLTSDIESFYYQYVRNNIPYNERGFIVSSAFKAADYFDANVDEFGIFGSTFLKPYDNIETTFGLKFVDLSQTVYQYQLDSTNPDMTLRSLIQRIPESLAVKGIYPSASLKYKYDEDNHFDVAVSKTYIVPDLREFTNGEYFHPYDVATVVGNPNLENTNLYNLDFKYSHYISDSENIKGGLFFKYLDKPIEDVIRPSSSLPIYSYDNADSAILYGVEVDGRKNFDFLGKDYSNYYVSGNFSYTESDVTLREEQLATYSTNHRQLQGLSQIVLNTTIGYDNDKRNIALSYNKMGERIRKIGVIDQYAYPDYYETPPQLLDLVWQEKFKNLDTFGIDNLDMKIKIGNILDDETVWRQGTNVTNTFKTGQTISVGISSKF